MIGARPVVLIDFEASALIGRGVRSFPIEVALGWPDSGDVREWLIRPEPEWLESWDWSAESEKIHGLRIEYLQENGKLRERIAREVLAAIDGHEPLSDNPAFEQVWLWILNGGAFPGVRIGALGELLEEIAGPGPAGAELLRLAHASAQEIAPKTHRAAADVRHMMALLRELLRLKGPAE